MKLAWFGVEEWLNPMDSLARINLGSSCVSALRMDELFDLTGEDLDAFLNEMRTMSLHYHHGDATGSPRIKAAVAGIYPKGNVKPEEVMITHGGTGANDLVLISVLEPGDNCALKFRFSPDLPGFIECFTITVDDSTDDWDDTFVWADITIEGDGFDMEQTQEYTPGTPKYRSPPTTKPVRFPKEPNSGSDWLPDAFFWRSRTIYRFTTRYARK